MKEIARLLIYVKKYMGRFCLAVLSMIMLAVFTLAITIMFKPIFEEMLSSSSTGDSSFISFFEK